MPGGIALLSDTVCFLTLLTIDIGIIRELAENDFNYHHLQLERSIKSGVRKREIATGSA